MILLQKLISRSTEIRLAFTWSRAPTGLIRSEQSDPIRGVGSDGMEPNSDRMGTCIRSEQTSDDPSNPGTVGIWGPLLNPIKRAAAATVFILFRWIPLLQWRGI